VETLISCISFLERYKLGKSNLDVLNDLLSQCENIPLFRRTVSRSLSNLKWIKKVVSTDKGFNPELVRLCSLDPKTIFEEYSAI